MKIRKKVLLGICFSLLLLSCKRNSSTINKKKETKQEEDQNFNFDSKIKYSKNFEIKRFKNYKIVNIIKQNKILYSYCLIPVNSNFKPKKKYNDIIEVPVKNIVALSSSYLGALTLLGVQEKLIAVSDTAYLCDSNYRKKAKRGSIVSLGESYNLNVEKTINISPNIIMLSLFDNTSAGEKRLKKAGAHLIYNADWQEISPLGRCEWIKFIAVFFNKEQVADSIFNSIEKKYFEVKEIANKSISMPKIMAGIEYNDIWYTPSGNSYKAKFFKDAKCDYYWNITTSTGSEHLSFETVLDKQLNSDIWIVSSSNAFKQIKNNKKYQEFKAYKNNQIYNNLKKRVSNKGNFYFEDGIYNPHLILKDLIKIFHPKLLSDYKLNYYLRLPKTIKQQ